MRAVEQYYFPHFPSERETTNSRIFRQHLIRILRLFLMQNENELLVAKTILAICLSADFALIIVSLADCRRIPQVRGASPQSKRRRHTAAKLEPNTRRRPLPLRQRVRDPRIKGARQGFGTNLGQADGGDCG
jgi:hypothetical protein